MSDLTRSVPMTRRAPDLIRGLHPPRQEAPDQVRGRHEAGAGMRPGQA